MEKHIGAKILIREQDGLCHFVTWGYQYPSAWPSGKSNVRGWGNFDGDDRQWYRAGVDEPETAWEFCFRLSHDDE